MKILLTECAWRKTIPVLFNTCCLVYEKTRIIYKAALTITISIKSGQKVKETSQSERNFCDSLDPPHHPALSPNAIIAINPRSLAPHVISNGSPSRIRSVRRISLGITTLPNSSILRTIPVARICFPASLMARWYG